MNSCRTLRFLVLMTLLGAPGCRDAVSPNPTMNVQPVMTGPMNSQAYSTTLTASGFTIGSLQILTHFDALRYVKVEMSGMVTKTNGDGTYNTSFGPVGNAPNCYEGGTVVSSSGYPSEVANAGWNCQPWLKENQTYTQYILAQGTVRAERGSYGVCYDPGCPTYSGSMNVTVTPVDLQPAMYQGWDGYDPSIDPNRFYVNVPGRPSQLPWTVLGWSVIYNDGPGDLSWCGQNDNCWLQWKPAVIKATVSVNGFTHTVSKPFYVNADMELTADSGTVAAGSPVTFKATAKPGLLGGQVTPLHNIRWRWIPDGSTEQPERTFACSASSGAGDSTAVCVQPISESGVLEVRANWMSDSGKEFTKRVHVKVRPPCPTQNPSDSLIDEHTVRRELLRLLQSSNPTAGGGARRERSGRLIYNTGTQQWRLVSPTSETSTPCNVSATYQMSYQPGDILVAIMHSHPFHPGNTLPSSCNNYQYPGGPSMPPQDPNDFNSRRNANNEQLPDGQGGRPVESFIIDRQRIYRLAPTPADPYGFKNWRHDGKEDSCNWYPNQIV